MWPRIETKLPIYVAESVLQLPVSPEINDTTDASDKENEDPQDEVVLGESHGEETSKENSKIILTAWQSRKTEFGEDLESSSGDRILTKTVSDKITKTINELSKRK